MYQTYYIMVKCIVKDCKQQAYFSNSKQVKAYHCSMHKREDEFSVKYPLCEVEDCVKLATWGLVKMVRCGLHKKVDDINIANKSKQCREPECKKTPCYGSEKNKPLFCAGHKKENMWLVSKPKCTTDNCLVSAGYGIEPNKALKCYQHKLCEHIYVLKNRKCKYETCNKIPSYGIENSSAEYCKEHKPNELYIDVNHYKLCEFKGCKKRPGFGEAQGDTATFCAEHKPEMYIDVLNKRCEHQDCNKYPAYGGVEGMAIRCSEHKTDVDFNVFTNLIKERYHKNKNKPAQILRRQQGYINRKDKITLYMRQYNNKTYFKKLANKCLQRSKNKKLSYDITQEFIEYKFERQNNKCIYCNCELEIIGDVGKRKMNLVSVDRINSNIGYIKGNIQLTCMFCNYAKNRWSDLEYKDFLQCLITKNNSNHLQHKISVTRYMCQQMSITWTIEQFDKQNGKCFYSRLDLIPCKQKYYMYQPSIERLDCNVGYTPENCVLVCLALNYARNNCDIENFKEHLLKISL